MKQGKQGESRISKTNLSFW